MNVYRDIYEQFANDAAFFWVLRCVAVNQPHYVTADLVELEQRIEAQLDGLMTNPEDAWTICSEALSIQQKGEAFAAAMVAFRSGDVAKIQYAIETCMEDREALAGLASALGWLPGSLCHSWIKKLLTSNNLDHKYLAITACSLRREDPREYLTHIFQREDCISHPLLYARSLRLVGELKRRDLLPAVLIALRSDQPEIVFWASWASVMLGDLSALQRLQPFVLQASPYQAKAIELAFRVLPLEDAHQWVDVLARDPAQIRNAIKASAVLGDPQAVYWLIAQMQVPALSRLAGEAFVTITGIDLEESGLTLDLTPDFHDGPNDDPSDSDISMDDDERLPFPHAANIASIWQDYQHRFIPGQRYLMGQPIGIKHLAGLFKTASQRQRRAAALELALLQTDHFLLNYAAKGGVV